MNLFSSLPLLLAGVSPQPQDAVVRRAGFACILWPDSASGSVETRRAKEFHLSWAFPDGEFEGHKLADIELLEVPSLAGEDARPIFYSSDGRGFGLAIQGKNGGYMLSAVPREGRSGEFEVGLGPIDRSGSGTENVGACRTILADEKMIAGLKGRNGN